MVLSQSDMIQMKVDTEIVAGRLITSVDNLRPLVDHRQVSIAGKAPPMVCMIPMQALTATHRVVLIVVNEVAGVVSNVAVEMTEMSIGNVRLRDDSRVRLEILMVTQSTLNGIITCLETISGSLVAPCS
jgi:hypothetical protein